MVLVSSAGLSQEFPAILRLGSIPGLGELMGFMVLHGSLEKRITFVRKSWPDTETVPDEMIQLKFKATLWQDMGRTFTKTLRANANFWGMKRSVFRPIVEGLPRLDNPILVVWGDQDDMLPVSQAQIVKDRAPHTRVEIFENCKHDPMIVNLQKFNQLVLDFLGE